MSGTLNIIYPVFKAGKWHEVTEPLQLCIREICYVDLDSFNEQGMPAKKSAQQRYNFGTNIHYYFEVDGANVAMFGAGSVRAWLNGYCDRGLSLSGACLGVRAARTKI